MSALKNKIFHTLNALYKPSVVLILAITLGIIVSMDAWRNWHKGQSAFSWDVANYYAYLPAYFGNNGSFEFNSPAFVNDYLPKFPADGKHIPKTTYGVALLYSPWYALGYKVAINQNDPRDGFSEPFATVLHWGTILYGLLGLILLRNFLIKFYSEKVTTLTLAVIFLGTSLFYYSVSMPEMPHGLLFFLFSAFLLTNYHWHRKPGISNSLLLGALIGLIALIRPTDLMIVFVFILWNIGEKFNWKNKLQFFLKQSKHILLMLLSAFIIWLPQMLFWKARTGHYLYFSYPGEQFFWGDPQITNVLFSYRKGLVVYTPLIALAFAGFFLMRDTLKSIRTVLLALVLLNTYLVSCWWDWFFGGCFAARAFVQHFAYYSIPLASLIAFVFEKSETKIWSGAAKLLTLLLIFSGIALNLFQSMQYTNGLIHHNSMSKKTYWLVFGKYKLNEQEQSEFWNSLKEPDYEKLRSGENRDQ
jgi:hypothetical protein